MHYKVLTSKVQKVSSSKLNKVQKTCYMKINWSTSFSKKKDPQPNPLPKPPFSTFVTWIQFFLMIGKSNNLSVTKRKGELNHMDGFWSLFFLYFVNKYYIFIIKSVVFEQAQQLFQIHAQTITPEALESVKAALQAVRLSTKQKPRRKYFLAKLLAKLRRTWH